MTRTYIAIARAAARILVAIPVVLGVAGSASAYATTVAPAGRHTYDDIETVMSCSEPAAGVAAVTQSLRTL